MTQVPIIRPQVDYDDLAFSALPDAPVRPAGSRPSAPRRRVAAGLRWLAAALDGDL